MGKFEKPESKKPETSAPATHVEAPVTAEVVSAAPAPAPTQTALAPRPTTTILVPRQADLDALALESAQKFDALCKLVEDPELSVEQRQKVEEIVAQANPHKPGLEEVASYWSIPRIQISQPTTTASSKPDSAKNGDLYSTAGQLLERPFGIIPIYFGYENIKFVQGEKAPECSSPDSKFGSNYGNCQNCVHLPFGLQNGGKGKQNQTECQRQLTVCVLAADLSQVYLVTFAKTGFRAGNALLALARAQSVPWKQSYMLSTEKGPGDKGVYWIYKVDATSRNNSPETLKVAKALNELYTVNRRKFLAEFYAKVSAAPQAAAIAEAEYNRTQLGAGLDPDAEPDLSAPVASTSSVRGSGQVM